ncbi:DNA-binding transcriptional regulator, MocR family, contains an aminotransferase domain [Microbulbifer donghaiensis]|uniref:DNA-binding transcriptional regulator, MocR family, contains an aminotransferase domain n=1 Tax=Microbulbifer donghaiensis TaxID=494016 RepID=A0A1M4UR95_9GAMM|nr:PLP-dependent aminotransferase family protein [Microbulbifer donghaiensis]SHE59209.1 DNA-binding transcriptional regulator, MocR family, contains an aminotransferase domain [Microbulbifer donghaiensis]
MAEGFRYQQLEAWLLQGIADRRWRQGERLPSIRTLCREQAVSKATVQHALQRLEARGLVEARPKAGYFVAPQPVAVQQPLARARIEAPRPVTASDLLLDIMGRSAAFDLLPDHQGGEIPPGIVALNRSIGRSLRRQSGDDFQYYDQPAGDNGLREQLALHVSRRGWKVDPDQLCVTSGCQHALFLALMACCRRGDVVAVESPGFYGVMQLIEQLDLQIVEVPASSDKGMDIDALEEVLQRWEVTACVVSPAFATPSGAMMPDTAKKRLLDLAEQYDLAVIEDDIYADTAFEAVPDPLKALDADNRVILCSSFSKCLSRDLRLGWVSGARWHARILHLKLVTQLASSRYLQQGVADFMEDGSFAAHLRRQRNQLRERRDRLLALLQAWPEVVRASDPRGGLAVWVELPEHVDTLAIYSDALEQGVVITPGPLFSASGQFRNCLRISFAHPWEKARVGALNRLPALLFGS